MINYAFAQSYNQAEIQALGFLQAINNAIVYPLITLLTAVALLLFLWGGFQYIYNAGNEQGREAGRKHLVWGVIGLLVMISAWSILTIAAGSFPGLRAQLDQSSGTGSGLDVSGTRPTPRPSTGTDGTGATTGTDGTGATTGTNGTGATLPSGALDYLASDLINGGMSAGQTSGYVGGIGALIRLDDRDAATTQANILYNNGHISDGVYGQLIQDINTYTTGQ